MNMLCRLGKHRWTTVHRETWEEYQKRWSAEVNDWRATGKPDYVPIPPPPMSRSSLNTDKLRDGWAYERCTRCDRRQKVEVWRSRPRPQDWEHDGVLPS